MDAGVELLFSPYATAFAAGALFAFCVALLKQRYNGGPPKKRRRDSAPETSSLRDPSSESSHPGLAKFHSVDSLCTGGGNNLEVPAPTISNFPAFDGSFPTISGLPCIAKLRSFTFSDDLMHLERKFSSLRDDCNVFDASKSYSLPNFHGSRSYVFGGVYPRFQPFAPRHHQTRFLNFLYSKPFQKNQRAVSLECPKLPVVYDLGRVLSKAAKVILKTDFRGADNLGLRKRRSLPCFLRDANAKFPPKDSKTSGHSFVQFPSTNVEIFEYQNPEKISKISEVTQNSGEVLSFKPSGEVQYANLGKEDIFLKSNSSDLENNKGNLTDRESNPLQYWSSTKGNKISENQSIDSAIVDISKLDSDSSTTPNQIQDSLYYEENSVLESYAEIINCSKNLSELDEIEVLNSKRENFIYKNTDKNKQHVSQGIFTGNQINLESSYSKEKFNDKAQISGEISRKSVNLYHGNEIEYDSQIFTEHHTIKHPIVENSCSSGEVINSGQISSEFSTLNALYNNNSCSSGEIIKSEKISSQFPTLNASHNDNSNSSREIINSEQISSEFLRLNVLNNDNSCSSGEIINSEQISSEFPTLNALNNDNSCSSREIINCKQIYSEFPTLNASKNESSCSSREIINFGRVSLEFATQNASNNENVCFLEEINNSDQNSMESSSKNSSTLKSAEKNENSKKEFIPPALRHCQDAGVPRDSAGKIEAEKSINSSRMSNNFPKENLGKVQEAADNKSSNHNKTITTQKKEFLLSFTLETKRRGPTEGGKGGDCDVTRGGGAEETSRTRGSADERQMDRGTRGRSVDGWNIVCAPARVFESSVVSSETRDGVTTTTTVSSVSSSDPRCDSSSWSEILDATFHNGTDMSVRTVISECRTPGKIPDKPTRPQLGAAGKPAVPAKPPHLLVRPQEPPFRPTFEEYMPESKEDESHRRRDEELLLVPEEEGESSSSSPPRVSRLLGLLSRDEERRAAKSIGGAAAGGESEEWDEILRDVLASVSELERCGGKGGRDVTDAEEEEEEEKGGGGKGSAKDAAAADVLQSRHFSSPTMEVQQQPQLSPPPTPNKKEETPTKVKSLRFKLDPDIFDVPSDDSFYDDDEEVDRGNWRGTRHHKYFHASLETGDDEPVRLVSVQASVVPAGQKMVVARPVGIDLRVRLTEERGKRGHSSPLQQQAKRRSPVSECRGTGTGWCQELSPVTENATVDWRENFSNNVSAVPNGGCAEVVKPMPNGILKTPSPKAEKDSSNPFKEDHHRQTNGIVAEKQQQQTPPRHNGMTPWHPPQKKFSLPRKKFEPDPEAVDRITGYKTALSKPPLPPPPAFHRTAATAPPTRNRADAARKLYLDSSRAALSAAPLQKAADGSQKFQQFLAQAQSDRARIVTSVPDLGAIERAVQEKWSRERGASPGAADAQKGQPTPADTPSSRGSTPDDAWSSYVQTCRKHLGRRSQSMSYLETDVDLMPTAEDEDKWRSTTALDHADESSSDHPHVEDSSDDFEDLDDSGRAKSEHELRVQRSLRSLPLPDWYRRSDKPKTGFLLKPSSDREKRGWAAAKSLASSTSSLASCGVAKHVHSLRSSRENIPWSRGISPSPSDGPALSLAVARAFRAPYLGWRARTPTTSSGVSSSPNSSWCAATTDEEANGISFDGEDACLGRTSSEEDDGGRRDEPPSPDDTGADAVTVSMDTGDLAKLPGGEDTCDDINNMSMDTCELFDASHDEQSFVCGESSFSPQADTGDDIDNLSTDTATDPKRNEVVVNLREVDTKRQEVAAKRNEVGTKRSEVDIKLREVDANGQEVTTRTNEVVTKRNEVDIMLREVDTNGLEVATRTNEVDVKRNDVDGKRNELDIKLWEVDSKRKEMVISKSWEGDTKRSEVDIKLREGVDAKRREGDPLGAKRRDPKCKRYSYSRSIYHSEWDVVDEESRGDRKATSPTDPRVIWIESSFVGSRTTTSIVVHPDQGDSGSSAKAADCSMERPASR